MSAGQHTPGPWYTGQSPNQAIHGQRSIGLGLEPDGSIFGYRLGVDNDDGAYMSLSGYCSEADARLICEAQNMLEALRRIQTLASEAAVQPSHMLGQVLGIVDDAARAAIAKATGSQS